MGEFRLKIKTRLKKIVTELDLIQEDCEKAWERAAIEKVVNAIYETPWYKEENSKVKNGKAG